MEVVYTNIFGEDFFKKHSDNFTGSNGFCYDQNGLICLVKGDGKDYWTLVGGGREKGESPEETFRREVREESQCDVKDVEYLHALISDVDQTPGFRFMCELVNIKEYVPFKDGHEIEQRKFVTAEEISEYLPWIKDSENGRESFEYFINILNGKLQK